MLYTLTYLSRALRRFSVRDLRALAHEAARFNRAHEITGVLFFGGGHFVQRLEGPENELLALMARIQQDERHELLSLVDHHPLAERLFPEWGMALVDQRLFEASFDDARVLLAALPTRISATAADVEPVARILRAALESA